MDADTDVLVPILPGSAPFTHFSLPNSLPPLLSTCLEIHETALQARSFRIRFQYAPSGDSSKVCGLFYVHAPYFFNHILQSSDTTDALSSSDDTSSQSLVLQPTTSNSKKRGPMARKVRELILTARASVCSSVIQVAPSSFHFGECDIGMCLVQVVSSPTHATCRNCKDWVSSVV